jgi:hypothetical protein
LLGSLWEIHPCFATLHSRIKITIEVNRKKEEEQMRFLPKEVCRQYQDWHQFLAQEWY